MRTSSTILLGSEPEDSDGEDEQEDEVEVGEDTEHENSQEHCDVHREQTGISSRELFIAPGVSPSDSFVSWEPSLEHVENELSIVLAS